MSNKQITMGAGLLPPQHAVVTTAPPARTTGRARVLLAAAAVLSPALFTVTVALDPAPLPREPAAEFLGAIADNTSTYVASTVFQMGSMFCGIAVAAMVALTFARHFPKLTGFASVLMALGYLGGMGFVGAKLVAADLTAGGEVRPGAEEIWTSVQSGPMFDILSWPLVMAVPGTVLLGVLLFRSRSVVGWWPSALIVLGFVASSGEFPDWVTLVGWVLEVPVMAVVARLFLSQDRPALAAS